MTPNTITETNLRRVPGAGGAHWGIHHGAQEAAALLTGMDHGALFRRPRTFCVENRTLQWRRAPYIKGWLLMSAPSPAGGAH
eukprot:8665784-Pyramimonas_sp.AAC.1